MTISNICYLLLKHFFILYFLPIIYGKNVTEDYNDSFTRTYLYPLSATAFSSIPYICLSNIFKNSTVTIKI